MSRAAALSDQLLAAGVPPGLVVRDRAGAMEVVYPPEATEEQRAAGDAVVAAFDPVQAVESRVKADTLAAIRTAGDLTSRGSRTSDAVLYTLINDLRERVGWPRLAEPEILALIAQAAEQGAGEPR